MSGSSNPFKTIRTVGNRHSCGRKGVLENAELKKFVCGKLAKGLRLRMKNRQNIMGYSSHPSILTINSKLNSSKVSVLCLVGKTYCTINCEILIQSQAILIIKYYCIWACIHVANMADTIIYEMICYYIDNLPLKYKPKNIKICIFNRTIKEINQIISKLVHLFYIYTDYLVGYCPYLHYIIFHYQIKAILIVFIAWNLHYFTLFVIP